MKKKRIRMTFLTDLLGGRPSNANILGTYIESKAPEGKDISDEIEERGVESVLEDRITGFSRDAGTGCPHAWDYQVKGYLKEAMGALKKIGENECSKIKAHKKAIDNFVFFDQNTSRRILFHNPDGSIVKASQIGEMERPLRAQTMQGERVSIARSETIPAGCYIEFDLILLDDSLEKAIAECFDYGQYKGFGQWRNAGWGIFRWEEVA